MLQPKKKTKQAPTDPAGILEEIWPYLSVNVAPSVTLRRQRCTGLYWTNHAITIREDSWNKMHLAERRLIVIHEAIHACKVPHIQGFRTANDVMSLLIYQNPPRGLPPL